MYRKTFTYNGKRYDIKANSKKELVEKHAQKLADLQTGRIISGRMTVEQWSQEWLETYKERNVGGKTYKDYQYRLENFILPKIGYVQLSNLKPAQCQAVLNDMNGYSKDRINKVSNAMYQMFRKAVKNGLMLTNPADDLEKPKAVDHTRRACTDFERDVILKVAENHPAGLWIKTMLYCGLRPGETARVLGSHVNIEKKTLYIDGTKTKAAKRTVPIPDGLVADFAKLSLDPFDYVFRGDNGQPLNGSKITRLWRGFWREMNIVSGTRIYRNQLIPPYIIPDDLVAYCLRHTYATDLKDAMVPGNIIKELMGHSNKDVTDRYTHKTDRSLEIARKLLSEYYQGMKKKTFSSSDVSASNGIVE